MNLKQAIDSTGITVSPFKKLAGAVFLVTLSFAGFAANAPANTASTQVNPQAQVPLNKYGAVDVSVDIPDDVQVPPAPANFVAPVIKPANQQWTSTANVFVPQAPKLNVKSYLLLDAQSGNVIASYDANTRIAPASLTKLMLLYIVEQQLQSGSLTLDTKLNVPVVAWATGGSRMFLKPHTRVEVNKLIQGVIVESGNDAAVTLAIGIAGSQAGFVDMMNMTAKRLGMTNTHFSDVMGLPAPNLYTSAHDLAILARHVVYDYPEYYHFFKEKYFKYNGIQQPNFNKLLFIDPNADGMKTGSTKAAGFSLISSAQDPNKRRLIAVVIGAKDGLASANDSLALYRYGNQFFNTFDLYQAQQKILAAPVYKGKEKNIALGTSQAVAITLPKGISPSDLKTSTQVNKGITAPITQGESLGTLTITYKDKTIDSVPLVALSNNPKGSIWQRVKGTVALWFTAHV